MDTWLFICAEFPKNVTEVRAWDLDYGLFRVQKDKNTWTIAQQ